MNPEVVHRRRWKILGLLAVTVLVVVMDITIVNVALNSIQRGLNASNAGLQWVVDSFMITFAAFIFTGGVCADRYGRKRALVAGLVLFGVASALAAVSGSITQLVVWRSVMGVGAAVVPTATLAIIINVFPPAERPKALAGWAAAAGLAFAMGPVVAGLLLTQFSWGSVFLVNVPLVIVGVTLIARIVPESKNPRNDTFDPVGVILSIVAMAVLVYGIVTAGNDGSWFELGVIGPILGGLALVAVLIAYEQRIEVPSLDISLFSERRFAAGTAAIALAFFALMGAIFITTFYFQAVHGYSPLQAGLLMVPMGAGSLFVSMRCPMLARKYGQAFVVAGGTTAMAVTFVLYSQLDRATSIWLLLAIQLLFGLGWGAIMAPATMALMSVVPPAKAAVGQAVSQSVRQVAAVLGVAVVGSILAGVYRSSIGAAVNILPEASRHEAANSVGGTFRALDGLQEHARTLSTAVKNGDAAAAEQLRALAPARAQASALANEAVHAYLSGMRATMLLVAAVALLASFVALKWLPRALPKPAAPARGKKTPSTGPVEVPKRHGSEAELPDRHPEPQSPTAVSEPLG
jgi:EmrB/QacA subfamily drug resistance transporter